MIKPKKAIDIISPQEIEPQKKWRLKLDKNENIYGCPNSVLSAIKNTCNEDITFYPNYEKLLKKTSLKYNLNKDNILFSNGTNEGLKNIFETFLEENEEILTFKPTSLEEILKNNFYNFNIRLIDYEKKFIFDEIKLKENIEQNTKIIYLETPNNPTGEIIRASNIEILLKEFKNILFVVNCSYSAYSNSITFEDYVDLLSKYENIVLIKSYSNDFAIAGLRLTLLLADCSIIANLKKTSTPYNINSIALNCALMLLNDEKRIEEIKELNNKAKELFENILQENNITFYKSEANFILCDFKNYCDFYYEKFKKQSVITKKYANKTTLENHLRITIPTIGGVKFINELLIKKDVLIFDLNNVILNFEKLLISKERIESLSKKYDLIVYSDDNSIKKLKEYEIEEFFYSINSTKEIEFDLILKKTPHKTIRFFSANVNNIIQANLAQIESIGIIPSISNHQTMINNYRHLGINYIMDEINNIENFLNPQIEMPLE